jgi:hypothetical protein
MKTLDTKEFRVVLAITLLLLIVFALHWCNSNPQPINEPIVNTNPLNDIVKDKDAINAVLMENNKVLRDSLFTLSQRKPKVIIRYKTVYDSLLVTDTACFNSLVMLNNQCADKDSINEFIISNQSSQIANLVTVTNNQQDIIDIRNYQHGVDSVNYEILKEQLPLEFKRGKRKGRKEGIAIGKAGELLKDGLYLYLRK